MARDILFMYILALPFTKQNCCSECPDARPAPKIADNQLVWRSIPSQEEDGLDNTAYTVVVPMECH